MIHDAELLRRYATEKDEAAFAELVRRQVDFVYGAALRQARGNEALAQDVAQTVFTDLARKAGRLAQHEVLAGWLHTATRFAVAKAIRADVRWRERERTALAMNEHEIESGATLDWERAKPVLDDALGELKERERIAILLRFFDKRSLAEVGERLALSETAARSCVDRALEKLRVRLVRRGVTSTAAALGVALANKAVVAAPTGLAASVTGAALAAGSMVGAGGALGFFIFMNTTKIVTGIASMLVGWRSGWRSTNGASGSGRRRRQLGHGRSSVRCGRN